METLLVVVIFILSYGLFGLLFDKLSERRKARMQERRAAAAALDDFLDDSGDSDEVMDC